MCGIMGIINKKGNAIKKVIEGLEKLEYRGYDSCGIAYLADNKILSHFFQHSGITYHSACITVSFTAFGCK